MVTAPSAEPRLMTDQSKDEPTGRLVNAASTSVPVGSVRATAVALVAVTMRVRNSATVSVAVAVFAVGAPCVSNTPSVSVHFLGR